MNGKINNLSISFFLNDKKVNANVRPDMTALELLREHFGLTGVKESCSEGDCGACTIAVGQLENNEIKYKAYNSCILPAIRLHGRHAVTVNGLAQGKDLHLIQDRVIKNHATQCGFCTPGIIMSLFCLFANSATPSQEEFFNALEGNLCRCTGYESIREAGNAIADKIKNNIDEWERLIFPSYFQRIENEMKIFDTQIEVSSGDNNENRDTLQYFYPSSLSAFYSILNQINDPALYRILNGGSDVMVEMNVRRFYSPYLVDISGIKELDFIEKKGDIILIGAATTLNQVLHSPLIGEKIPVLHEAVSKMASEQIRNIATLSGNIVNASPIADGAVSLLGLDATLVLISPSGERKVALKDFYKDYKVIDLKSDEIIGRIEIPVVNGFYSFEKFSKRLAVDIASVNSLCFLKLNNSKVEHARLSFGGIAKYPILAIKCMEYLLNKEINEETIGRAAQIASEEFTPISDVRGSAEFRKLLIRNNIIKHLNKLL